MSIRGYVVRGKCADAGRYLVRWTSADGHEAVGRCATVDEALAFRACRVPWSATHVRIREVAEDGTEAPLMSYAEAIAEIKRLRDGLAAERKAWAELVSAAGYRYLGVVGGVGKYQAAKAAMRALGVDVNTLLEEADS